MPPKAKMEAEVPPKRRMQPSSGEHANQPKRTKRSAACSDLKEKSIRLSEPSKILESKKEMSVEEELVALHLTSENDEGRPNRRLTDFIFHNSDGIQQPIEMLEVDDLFISGVILPLQDLADKEKDKGVRCDGFGRIETWAISGYEEGSPVVWVSTDDVDYDCLKPATCYKKLYDLFFQKAHACIEVYKRLSKSSGGSPDTSLDELLAATVRSMSGSKSFSCAASVKEFVISQGDFIYNQLVGLDETSKKNDLKFADLPVLVALRDEKSTYVDFVQEREAPSSGSLVIDSVITIDKNKMEHSGPASSCAADDDNLKYAKLLQEQEHWNSITTKKKQGSSSNLSKFYIKINEDEIANDYPLPAYYKARDYETDEYVIFDNDFSVCDTDQLPRSMLHNWSLYNSDMRLISLELLPMKPCADIDVMIFGSGVMTADDGFGFDLDANLSISASSSGAQDVDGMPVYLSAIKEWMIEFGSSMVFISIRTDLSWYRLGRPSKQYAPWYQPVLKTARLAISIITMLKEQSRVSRLSFADVIKKVSDFQQNHPAYISSNPAPVERYVAVHGQIILQQFAEYPDEQIKKCSFVLGLTKHMEERHHSRWLVKKKKISLSGPNLNPRAAMEPIVSKRKVMQLTTTKFINTKLGDKISNYLPEDSKQEINCEPKEEEEEDEEQGENANDDDNDNEESLVLENTLKPSPLGIQNRRSKTSNEILWDGESTGKTKSNGILYKHAIVCGELVSVGSVVLIDSSDTGEFPVIYFVEFMFETLNQSKMFHGRKMRYGFQTVLGDAANDRELFLTNDCMDFKLSNVKETIVVEIRQMPWGYQHRKENAKADKADKDKVEERKRKGLPVEYFCKSLYSPERGAFFTIPFDTLGLGSGFCSSCKVKEGEEDKEEFRLNSSKSGFRFQGIDYSIHDFVYVSPHQFSSEKFESETFKSGRNIGLKAYAVCQLVDLILAKTKCEAEIEFTKVRVRRFFRPEDISAEKAYQSDIREVYYCEETHVLPVDTIEGRCEVRKKNDLSSFYSPGMFEHIFFCERLYDPSKGSLKQLPAQSKMHYSPDLVFDAASIRKKKGKCKVVENDLVSEKEKDIPQNRLITLDIFSGCGGLSEGLEQSGATLSKWAIEYEEPAGEAFKINHPESLVFINNCNVILRAIMEKCGDLDDCISSPKAAEMVASMAEKEINDLPVPGEVDFITGGPPCQGFSGMNRFSHSEWSKLQCEMIWGFLSFADYFRPKYFLLENVRTFVSFNKGLTFRLTLALLLEMGYQVRFGILEAGAFGVSQSRKRVFIWAASPLETLPEWPEPMHVFSAPELKVTLSKTEQYAAACSTANGAPFRSITVRDTIGDLPAVGNGASITNLEYQNEAVSWFQRNIRGNSVVLTDHISKEMNELNLIRCKRIPKRAGCDWHELPDEKVKLSSGQLCDLIPFCLPNTAKRHNEWKGLYGRLDWEGNFPTSVTDPQPMGKVGMCFHPDQDRIVTVRECARSQGFPDGYKFCGNIQHKHRQIGNAVPPTLAFALGRKLKEAATKGE